MKAQETFSTQAGAGQAVSTQAVSGQAKTGQVVSGEGMSELATPVRPGRGLVIEAVAGNNRNSSYASAILVRLWSGDDADARKPDTLTWDSESALVKMLSDLLLVSQGVLDRKCQETLTAYFAGPMQSLVAARRAQKLIEGYAGIRAAYASIAICTAEQAGSLQRKPRKGPTEETEHRRNRIRSSQIVVIGELCEQIKDLPGLRLMKVNDAAGAKSAPNIREIGIYEIGEGPNYEPGYEPSNEGGWELSDGSGVDGDSAPLAEALPIAEEIAAPPAAQLLTEGQEAAPEAAGKRDTPIEDWLKPEAAASADSSAADESAPPTSFSGESVGLFARADHAAVETPSRWKRVVVGVAAGVLGIAAALFVAGHRKSTTASPGTASPGTANQQPQAIPSPVKNEGAAQKPSPMQSRGVAQKQVPASKHAGASAPQAAGMQPAAGTQQAAGMQQATGTQQITGSQPAKSSGLNKGAAPSQPGAGVVSADGFSNADVPDLMRRAQRASGEGQYDVAIRVYGVVLRLQPGNAEARKGLMRAQENLRETTQ